MGQNTSRVDRPDQEVENTGSSDASMSVDGATTSAPSSHTIRRRNVLSRLRRNFSSAESEATTNNEDDQWVLPMSSSRRRRRTDSSSDETSNERKRRNRSSTLRRLTQFGSNVFNSIAGSDDTAQASTSSASPPRASDAVSTGNLPTLSTEESTATNSGSRTRSTPRFIRRRNSNEPSTRQTQAAMISRLLAMAASVTASSLVGAQNTHRGNSGPRPGQEDNSFPGFLQGLNNGLLADELSRGDGSAPPRNFFRMFRFPAGTSDEEGRNMVPVLIVGVRAVEEGEAEAEAEGANENGPNHPRGATGSLFGANLAPPVHFDENERPSAQAQAQTSQTEEPRGTPPEGMDDDFWRIFSSQTSTSQLFNNPSESQGPDSEPEPEPEPESPPSPRYGTNEQSSNHEAEDNEGQHRRRGPLWIVYVVGGTYREDHPILLAPSLMTDNPTYEDLMTLQNFLGQVKPPQATKEEIKQAGGAFKVGDSKGIDPLLEQKCLICLSQYQYGEEVRKLQACKHMFHSACVDQWLTTGRNTCPLCRGEGVKKKSKEEEEEPSEA